MPRPIRRRASSASSKGRYLLAVACLGFGTHALHAQDASTAHDSVPTGLATTANPAVATAPPSKPVSERQARMADDAYLAGAKAIERGDFNAAERDFGRALQLDPSKPEYTQSLAIARDRRVAELISRAATAHQTGDTKLAETLLAQARFLAPDSPAVLQHFNTPQEPFTVTPVSRPVESASLPGQRTPPPFGAPIELKPSTALHTFHQSASAQDLLRAVYSAYGIKIQFPNAIAGGHTVRLDLVDADYPTATRIVGKLTKTFAVPVQADFALVVANTQEVRDEYQPLLEETLYMPGLSGDAMSELANIARQVFDLKQVTASQTAGDILVRGDAGTLRLLNATYADMLNGSSDVQIDISLYELDKSTTRNVGITTPSSAGGFSVYGELQSLLTQNASVIQAAITSGALTLTGNPAVDIPKEIAILYAAGDLSSVSQLTNLLGTVGSFGGIPLAGVYLGSGATLNLALNSSDVRTLDYAQLRASDHQAAAFKVGTRYPVITGTYSSGISSSTLSGLSASQQQLVNQYLGSSTSVSIPQFQYEDLGLSIKATPTIHQDGSVTLALDMKIEALGGTSINNVPVLNSRSLASTITVPTGQTVLLASEITKSEMRSLSGVPGLSDIPGFQGTDHDTEKDSSELLITLTPHIVRVGHRGPSSKLLAYDQPAGSQQ